VWNVVLIGRRVRRSCVGHSFSVCQSGQ
jgi:hypothetical protein